MNEKSNPQFQAGSEPIAVTSCGKSQQLLCSPIQAAPAQFFKVTHYPHFVLLRVLCGEHLLGEDFAKTSSSLLQWKPSARSRTRNSKLEA